MKINVTAIALLLGIMSSNEAIFGMGKHPRGEGDDTSEHLAKRKINPTALNAVENPKSECRMCFNDFLLNELEVLHSSKTSSSETIDHAVCKECLDLILKDATKKNKPLTCLTCSTGALTHPKALSYNLEYWINAITNNTIDREDQATFDTIVQVAQTARESKDLETYRKGLLLFSTILNNNYKLDYAPATAAAAEKASIDFSYDTRQLGLSLFNDLILRYPPVRSNLLAAAQAGETKHSFYVQSTSLNLYKALVDLSCTVAYEPATRAALNALQSQSTNVRQNGFGLLAALINANHKPALLQSALAGYEAGERQVAVNFYNQDGIVQATLQIPLSYAKLCGMFLEQNDENGLETETLQLEFAIPHDSRITPDLFTTLREALVAITILKQSTPDMEQPYELAVRLYQQMEQGHLFQAASADLNSLIDLARATDYLNIEGLGDALLHWIIHNYSYARDLKRALAEKHALFLAPRIYALIPLTTEGESKSGTPNQQQCFNFYQDVRAALIKQEHLKPTEIANQELFLTTQKKLYTEENNRLDTELNYWLSAMADNRINRDDPITIDAIAQTVQAAIHRHWNASVGKGYTIYKKVRRLWDALVKEDYKQAYVSALCALLRNKGTRASLVNDLFRTIQHSCHKPDAIISIVAAAMETQHQEIVSMGLQLLEEHRFDCSNASYHEVISLISTIAPILENKHRIIADKGLKLLREIAITINLRAQPFDPNEKSDILSRILNTIESDLEYNENTRVEVLEILVRMGHEAAYPVALTAARNALVDDNLDRMSSEGWSSCLNILQMLIRKQYQDAYSDALIAAQKATTSGRDSVITTGFRLFINLIYFDGQGTCVTDDPEKLSFLAGNDCGDQAAQLISELLTPLLDQNHQATYDFVTRFVEHECNSDNYYSFWGNSLVKKTPFLTANLLQLLLRHEREATPLIATRFAKNLIIKNNDVYNEPAIQLFKRLFDLHYEPAYTAAQEALMYLEEGRRGCCTETKLQLKAMLQEKGIHIPAENP